MATTKKITEPAAELAPEKDALSEAVRTLIAALGLREEDVRGIDVRDKIVRVFAADNSLQTRKIEPLRRIQRDAQWKVIE